MVWFSNRAADVPAAWPWAGFTPAPRSAAADDAQRFRLIPAAPFLAGHFPGRPILPGVAIIDAALMACRTAARNCHLQLAAISGARFLSTVLPGDELTLRASDVGNAAWRITARVGTVLCARMTLHVTDRDQAPHRAAAPHGGHCDLDAADIAHRLPQRPPMLMLEGALRLADGRWSVQGRPHRPAATRARRRLNYPKSLICEGFFQAAGLALDAAIPDGAMLLLGSIGHAEFAAVPHASEGVRHIVTSSRMIGGAALVAGQTRTLDDALVATYADVLVAVRAAEPEGGRHAAGLSMIHLS